MVNRETEKRKEMEIRLLAFGIAKDIVGGMELNLVVPEASTIVHLKDILVNRFPEFSKLTSLRIAVNSEYVSDDYVIQANDEVVIIPPVSGG